jgi:hypothetical protein
LAAAKVSIETQSGETAPLFSNGDGYFTLNLSEYFPDFPVETGRQYRLKALLPNGNLYQSDWQILLPSPNVEGLRLDTFQTIGTPTVGLPTVQNNFQVQVSSSIRAPVANQALYLFWEIDQSYRLTDNGGQVCYAYRPLLTEQLMLLNGNTVGAERIEQYPLVNIPITYLFGEGYYLILYQQAVSADTYGYLYEVNQLLAKRGTLFDPPAGAVRSNIQNAADPAERVNGYFYTAWPDTFRLYISPAQAGYPKPYCPLPPSNGAGQGPTPPTPCDDCRLEPGGVYQKPSWWIP